VLVCSADPFTRRAFGSGASAPDIEVVARANLTEAVENLAAELEPEVVVLDVQVPAATALRAIQQLHLEAPDARILACDAPAGTEFGLLCLLAGAAGYMSKEADLAALPRILRALAAGEVVTPRALATELAHRFVSAARRAPKSSGHVLSRPESQVLELLRTGRPLNEIASDLGIRPSTAQRHLGSARRKLAVLASTPHRFQPDEQLEV
jgi:DNA-binding NarL/FixJ family response regulator